MSRNSALVAVSTGLLNSMSRDEAEAVLGHEITHIANGDMVTLTLIQGVVNTFVFFLSFIVTNILAKAGDIQLSLLSYQVLLTSFGLFANETIHIMEGLNRILITTFIT